MALVGAPVTLWLVATRVAPGEQGTYFVLVNLVALALFLEVGPGTILVQFAAHEWRQLHWSPDGDLAGDPVARSAIGAILHRGLRWYAVAALAFFLLAAGGGLWLAVPVDPRATLVPWWMATICLVALYFLLVPFLNVSEGCGAILPLQRMRSVQAAGVLAALWVGLLWGDALAACWLAALAQLMIAGGWLLLTRRGLLRASPTLPAALAGNEPGTIASRLRVELGKSAQFWIALYLAPQLLTPALLRLRGGSEAGQLGLTLALALAPLTISVAWLHGRYPAYAAMVAQKELSRFDRTARQAFVEATTVFVAGCVGVALLVAIVARSAPVLAIRLLPTHALVALFVGAFALLSLQAMAAWVRAFRYEVLRTPTVVACAAMSAGGIVGAWTGGGAGASVGFAAAGVAALLPVTFLFLRERRRLLG